LLKIFSTILIGIKMVWLSVKNAVKRVNFEGLLKNPLFFFALISVALFWGICASCDNSESLNANHIVFFNSFFNRSSDLNSSLFSSQSDAIPLETPDLKIMQDNTLCALSTPCVVSGKVLGDVFGGSNQNKKDVTNYIVQPGDTFKSIADSYNISVNTILWANEINSSSNIKVGQSLTILPIDGVLHIVKSGDIMSAIASKYKAKAEDIISFNGLVNQDDIYIGDILIIPGGVMPKNSTSLQNNKTPLANNYFIFPSWGTITQGLHYFNAMDLANKCGTPIYAAASGTVQRAVYNNSWNLGKGNYVTILHPNGTVTYYGHFEVVFVKPGDKVTAGDRIGLMGETGDATGCHVHFEVIGAANPLARYAVGAKINFK
jgi:murein DD-endopeptidase MepM/ murein hydrolase activator NlpD